jgi:putative transposase
LGAPSSSPERGEGGVFEFDVAVDVVFCLGRATLTLPKNLKRYYGKGDLHFITFSCYRRLRLLGTARARDVFVKALEEVRKKIGFQLAGFVVMPEHVHLLVGEPKTGNPSTVVHSLKLRVSKRMRQETRERVGEQRAVSLGEGELELAQFWQKRFYDFNVYSARKRREKIEYMHQNPVKRGLVEDPKDWVWSSYASYTNRGTELLKIDYVD